MPYQSQHPHLTHGRVLVCVLTSASNIIQMRQVRQPPVSLERVDLRFGSACEDLVDVRDDGLDVRGAVLRHVLPDGLEVTPEIAVCPMTMRIWCLGQ